MTDVSRSLSRLSECNCPLRSDDLLDFRPEQILYREIFIPEDPRNEPEKIRYERIDKPSKFRPDLFERILWRASEYRYARNDDDDEEDHYLDIPIYIPSIIIIQISKTSQSTFAEVPVKFEARGDGCPDHLYGGLRFVGEGGQASKDWFAGCKLIYFCARAPHGSLGDPYRQALCYYVDRSVRLFQIDPDTSEEIDPDIRHPGNGGETTQP